MASMTDKEKIAHILRRFGLGAGKLEVDQYLPLGVHGTLDKVLSFQKTDSGFTLEPSRLYYEKSDSDANMDSYIISMWWGLRMWLTKRPLEEKLSLFWHNNLAVGADKVDFAPLNLNYLQLIHSKCNGKFSELLKSVGTCAAMLKYLDEDESIAGRPNENFAREVMELFTLGIGNYTEQDVHEAARVFTGFGLRYPLYEGDVKQIQQKIRIGIEKGIPMVGGTWSADLHDSTPKTIFGVTANYTPSEFMDVLAAKPETAKRIGTKLFEYFAKAKADSKVQDHMAKTFQKSEGDISKVLREIAYMDEFWAPDAVLHQIKSPVDFTVSIYRQLGLAEIVRKLQGNPSPLTPAPKEFRDSAYYLVDRMSKQGLQLLYPPTVKGWDWGEAWITAQALTTRIEMSQQIFWAGDKGKRVGDYIAKRMLEVKPTTSEEGVLAFLDIFDGNHLTSYMPALVKAFESGGGVASLSQSEKASYALSQLARLVFASDDFQFC